MIRHHSADLIRTISDFPEPGIQFKDITPVLADGAALGDLVDDLAAPFHDNGISHVVGIEARGFILAAPVALRLGAGFVPVRKPGKLPYETRRIEYELEYGTDSLEIHDDALGPGDQVLIVDDVIATGGTAAATVDLVESLGAHVAGFAVYVELAALGGRARLGDLPITALMRYEG